MACNKPPAGNGGMRPQTGCNDTGSGSSRTQHHITTTTPPQHHITTIFTTSTTSPPPHHHAQHHITTILRNTVKYEFSGRMLTPPQQTPPHQHKNTTPPHTSCTGCYRKGRDTHRKVRKLSGKMNISSWAGCCRTPKSTKISRKHQLQFLGRMLQNTEKYENYQEKWTWVLGPDVAEHRKVRKLAGNIDFSSWAGCCRTPKSTKIIRKNEHEFLGRMLQNTEKYEN